MRFYVSFAILAVLSAATIVHADPRPFTFVTDTYAVGKGNGEFEQWVTWKQRSDADPNLTALEFRSEFEFGLADNFDLSIYVANWSYQDGQDGASTTYDSSGIEGVLYFLNPVTDIIGLGWYNEITVGRDELAYETKLLVQKDIGNWVLSYNLVLETEIEGVFDVDTETEVNGSLENNFGASYAIGKGDFRVGGELTIASEYADWDQYNGTTVYAGPVFSYWGGKNWWVTVTPTYQLSSQDEEADFKMRMIAGIEF